MFCIQWDSHEYLVYVQKKVAEPNGSMKQAFLPKTIGRKALALGVNSFPSNTIVVPVVTQLSTSSA